MSTLDYIECTKVDGMAKKAFVVNAHPPLIAAAALYDLYSYERHSHMSFNKGHSVHSLFLFMTLLSAAMDVLP